MLDKRGVHELDERRHFAVRPQIGNFAHGRFAGRFERRAPVDGGAVAVNAQRKHFLIGEGELRERFKLLAQGGAAARRAGYGERSNPLVLSATRTILAKLCWRV
jgi:hypothetical protein